MYCVKYTDVSKKPATSTITLHVPWRKRRLFPLKPLYTLTRLHGVISKKTEIFESSQWASFKPYVRIPQGSYIAFHSTFLSIISKAGTSAQRNRTKHNPYYRVEDVRGVAHLLIGQLVLSATADTAGVVMLSTTRQQLLGNENTTRGTQANITSTDRQSR